MEELPLGITDFRKVREEGYRYIDKTSLIDEVLRSGDRVFFLTRPPGFGKSLAVSMLDCYLNIEYAGNAWFDGLEISGIRPDDPMKNSSPVVFLDLSDIRETTFKSFLKGFRTNVMGGLTRFGYLMDSDRVNQLEKQWLAGYFGKSVDPDHLSTLPGFLSRCLERHHGRRAVVLMDGYDRLLDMMGGEDEFDMTYRFLHRMLLSSVRAKAHVIATGWVPIGMRRVSSVHDSIFSDKCRGLGFTEDDVGKLLVDVADTKEVCSTYRVGDRELFSPGEVIEHACDDDTDEWLDGILFDRLLDCEFSWNEFDDMDAGGSVKGQVSDRVDYSTAYWSNEDGRSMLAMAGYIRAVPDGNGEWNLSLAKKYREG